MGSVLWRAEVHPDGTIFSKCVQQIESANDDDIIERSKRYATVAFSATELESANMAIAVSESKTK